MLRKLIRMHRRKNGQSLVEYVLIIALIAIVLIVALNQLGVAIVTIPFATVIAVL